MEEIRIDLDDINPVADGGESTISASGSSVTSETEIQEDILDPNKIIVTIGDKKTPIIMLFGPRSSGKSMTLVRLSNFLRKKGYKIVVDPAFRPGESYRKMCNEFDKKMSSNEAQDGNALTDFMLIKVVQNGRTICQFLEAPGEHYFDPSDISAGNFPPYMQTVTTLPNRKIWVFIAESNWPVDSTVKDAYVERIANCKSQLMGTTDRSIILNNKVDRKSHLIYGKAQVHVNEAIQEVDDEYPGIFKIFKNEGLFSSMFRKYNCKYVPFTTGSYRKALDGKQTYTPSPDEWPTYFWNAITECLKG